MQYLSQLSRADLQNKKVLVRVDFNVPVTQTNAGFEVETFRIQATKPTIDFLLEHGARVALMSHLTDIDSFEPIMSHITDALRRDVFYGGMIIGKQASETLKEHELMLLENIRQQSGEEKNDADFAKGLAEGFDLYINDAFGVCHREHASVGMITQYLPSYPGLLIEKEVAELHKVIEAPMEGKVMILGGAKIATKLPVIKNFLDKAEVIMVGGAIANTILKAKGQDVGNSLVDDIAIDLQTLESQKIVLPTDFIVDRGKNFDIGDMSRQAFTHIIKGAKRVIWNGPMGLFEDRRFASGTQAIGHAVAQVPYSIVGGGDTIAAVKDMLHQFSHVSTGGGAMLEFLAGKQLPGLRVLGYYD